jgi:putative DNA primase/helicase
LEDKWLHYDGLIHIATGESRKETLWKNVEIYWSEYLNRIAQTKRTYETAAVFRAMPKAEQDEIKDVGGFVGGTLLGGHRKSTTVSLRYLITLDADYAPANFWALIQRKIEAACAVYSTHKHSPSAPRLRLVLPLQRPVTAEEYPAVARAIARAIGIDYFDDTTYEPSRLMYWPSTSCDAEYVFEYQDKPWIDPEILLNSYKNWRDVSEYPYSKRTETAIHRLIKRQGDPLLKPGVIGAFCRAHDIHDAIQTFLPTVYLPTSRPDRYSYAAGTSYGGLVVYDQGRFAYSNHSTDPVSQRCVNAFDLVRIHLFHHLDELQPNETDTTRLPSYQAMISLALQDEGSRQQMDADRQAELEEAFRTNIINPIRLFFEDGKFIPAYLGEWFQRKYRCLVNDSGTLYAYQDGAYRPAERLFAEESTVALGRHYASRRVSEALSYTKNCAFLAREDAVENLLNVKNGLLDLETWELHPHDPNYISFVQLPVEFSPHATCPYIDAFFEKVVPSEIVPLLEEVIGFCLSPDMSLEKAILFHGKGGNGKGTFLAVLIELLGQHNVSNVSLQALSDNRFAASSLYGKLANIHSDIPSKMLEDTSLFKELVSGDMIQAEEKFKPPFQFKNRAKLLFSMNSIPSTKDLSHAFFRRLLFIPFEQQFDDKELRKRLFSPQELSGLLLRGLKGLRRLNAQGKFSNPEAVTAALETYQERVDSVYRFVKEFCTFEDKKLIPKQEVYYAYRNACFEWGNQPLSMARFSEQFQNRAVYVKEYRKGTPRCWRNLNLLNTNLT